jgi:hypothetical protein
MFLVTCITWKSKVGIKLWHILHETNIGPLPIWSFGLFWVEHFSSHGAAWLPINNKPQNFMQKACTISTRYLFQPPWALLVALDFPIFCQSSTALLTIVMQSCFPTVYLILYLSTWNGHGEVWWGYQVHLVIHASHSVGDEPTFILSLKYRKQPSKWVWPHYIFLMIVAYMSHALGGMYWHPCIFSFWAVGYIRSDPLLCQPV